MRYCLVMRRKIGRVWKRTEWKWIIFQADDLDEVLEKVKWFLEEYEGGGWTREFLGGEI